MPNYKIIDVLKQQMPLLTQRLHTTLEQLRAPIKNDDPTRQATTGSLMQWWNQLQIRYTDRHIDFSTTIDKDAEIPVDVFTTAIENLLDNARSKRIREPNIKIFVKLSETDGRLKLSVIDTGSAIDQHIAPQLFKEIISSNDGFGIGLYQSYELAKNHGYELKIDTNLVFVG